jgi:hypothetical protein
LEREGFAAFLLGCGASLTFVVDAAGAVVGAGGSSAGHGEFGGGGGGRLGGGAAGAHSSGNSSRLPEVYTEDAVNHQVA